MIAVPPVFGDRGRGDDGPALRVANALTVAGHRASSALTPLGSESETSERCCRRSRPRRLATGHRNFRLEFDTLKNARANSPVGTDAPPARVGFSKSRTADTITALDVDRHATPAAFSVTSLAHRAPPRRTTMSGSHRID